MTIEEIDRKVAPQFPMVGYEHARRCPVRAGGMDRRGRKGDRIVGEDHVSLGSDFDGGPTPPRGMHDISDCRC